MSLSTYLHKPSIYLQAGNDLPMNSARNYSLKTINLIVSFRKYLYSQNFSSVESYFERQKFGNPGQISKFQFQKIIQHLQPFLNFNAFDIFDIFKQLGQGQDFISIKRFLQIYNQITAQIPSSQIQNKKQAEEQEKKRLQEQKQRKNKIIRIGLQKLQAFVDKSDPIAIFHQFDEDFSGKLNPNQFNKLLICTGIKQFQDRMIRRYVLAQIFHYFPNKQIRKEQFFKLFKVPKQKLQKKNNVEFFIPPEKNVQFKAPQPPKVSPIKNQFPNKTYEEKKPKVSEPTININIRPPQNKNVTFDRPNDGFKKKNIYPEQKISPIKKKQQIYQKKDDFINSAEIFPRASTYYRNGQPLMEELRYLEQLENILRSKKVYQDSSNPKTPKGQYYQALNFFKGQGYHLFQMAQSVLQRQVSRIGLARQIEPKDIIQGQIGDCYFLSSIASLISIYPEVISEKFLFNQNPANYFVVKIFLDGQWKYIVTDDCFPSKNGKDPVYAKPHGRQIWVMLLEKCWAKCFGDFQSIVSGSPKEAFIALTGAPTQYFSLKSNEITKEVIEKKIKQAYDNRYVVTASGSEYLDSLSESQQQKLGLISNHAYSFLKFIHANGNSLVKIRNPWGSRIWKGDWSFESNKWTKELRNKFNYNRSPQDGSFYMSMNDFLKYFGSFVICKLNPISCHTSLNMNYRKHKSNYTKIKVSESGRYILSLYQQNQRKMKSKYSNYDYSPARIILMKVGKSWEYIDSFQNSRSYSVSIEVNLEEGAEYIISSKVKWKFWQSHEACLTSYGPDKVIFEPMDSTIAPVFKSEMIESFFKKNRGKVKQYNKTGAIGSYSQSFFSLEKGIGYYFITNPSQKKWSLSYSLQGQGVKVIKPDKLPFSFFLTKQSRFLKGFFTSPQGYNYQTNQTMTY